MSTPEESTPTGGADVPAPAPVQPAGAVAIRNVIGPLRGLVGGVRVMMGLVAFTPEEAAKTEGLNANLWAGLAMLVVGILFMVWTKVDPIRMVVRDNEPGAEDPHDIAAL